MRLLHSLRHAFGSKLATEGVELYTIQKLLRHSDPRMTQRYSELADKALINGSAKAGELFSQIKKDSDNKEVQAGPNSVK